MKCPHSQLHVFLHTVKWEQRRATHTLLKKEDHRCAGGRRSDGLKLLPVKAFSRMGEVFFISTAAIHLFILNCYWGHCLHKPPFHVRKEGRERKKKKDEDAGIE